MRRKWFFIAPAALAGILLFTFVGGEVVMRLWNWLLPPLFGWHLIAFWQAVGLLALCRILFGHHGWRGRGHSAFRDRMRQRMSYGCGGATPEEREKFRQAMRERWGLGPSPSESKGQ